MDKYEAIRKRAHDIWERQGRPEGRHEDHWREAEAKLLAAAGDRGNEGEGNKTAAFAFDRSQTESVQNADLQALGSSARGALEGAEGAELKTAEEQARSRSRGEDPALNQKAGASSSARSRT
jgi:hypothetical protein